jgi:DNA-binding NarL/FixJ family response regulator
MNEPYGILLCDDFIFTSRIAGEAKAQGLALRPLKKVADLRRFSLETTPRCVIIDLNLPDLVIGELVSELAALMPKPMIVGYGSHVDAPILKKARDAGCDIVWPRSKFAEELAASLPIWFKPAQTPP